MADAFPTISRRALLQGLGAGAGLLVARGLGADGLGRSAARERSTEGLLRELGASFTPRQRELIVLPADHPTRQITNTISVIHRPHVGTLLSPRQLSLVEELTAGLLSPRGRSDFAGTFAVEGRFEGCVLAIYGEPEEPGAQVVVQGGHVMLRGGGSRGEAASPGGPWLGGGVSYGHQVGNHRWRVEGNSFAHHGDAANRLYAALSPAERRRAVLAEPPHELVLQVQGAGARIPGVRFGDLADEAREAAEALVATVLGSFPEARQAEARACLDANGGLDALHFATYESKGFHADMRPWSELDAAERARRGDPYWQVWRVEGPGAVLHFQGHPHVHAYVNVVRDPAHANLGEVLGETRRTLEGASMGRILDAALRRATGEALAWHGPEVPGRFCAGPITTGLAFALDPYGNRLAVVELEGRALAAPLRAHLASLGVRVEPAEKVRVATIDYLAREPHAQLGDPLRVEYGDRLMRDALVEHLRAGALEARLG